MKIKIEDMGFQYNEDAQVLHHIDLDLNEKGLICIIGPNGVGKSTLIKCINKLHKPTSGTVLIDGKSVNDYKLKDLAKVMGYVPASANDTFSMTVLDTILMGRHPHSKVKATREDLHIVYEVMKELNIMHLAMRNFDELSAGQHQKVAIARGLAQEPELLILDEPTSNLDIRHQIKVTELLYDLAHEGKMTVLMISHDLNVAARYADKIIVMSTPGVIYDVGHPNDVITEEMIRYVYGMNCEVVYSHDRPHIILDTAISDEEMIELHKEEGSVDRNNR